MYVAIILFKFMGSQIPEKMFVRKVRVHFYECSSCIGFFHNRMARDMYNSRVRKGGFLLLINFAQK